MCIMIGTIVTYILGAILHWRTIIYVSCVYPLGALIFAMVVPESPSWLVAKGNEAKYRRFYGDELQEIKCSPCYYLITFIY